MSGSHYYYPYAGGNSTHPSDASGNPSTGDYSSHTGGHPSQHDLYYDHTAVNGWPTGQDGLMQQQQSRALSHTYMNNDTNAQTAGGGYNHASSYDYPSMYYHHDSQTGMVTVPAHDSQATTGAQHHGYGNGGGSYTQHQPHPSAVDWNTNPAGTATTHASMAGTTDSVGNMGDPIDIFGGTNMAGNGEVGGSGTMSIDDSWMYQLANIVPNNQTQQSEKESSKSLKASRSSPSSNKPKKRQRRENSARSSSSPIPLYSNSAQEDDTTTSSSLKTVPKASIDPVLKEFKINISSLSQEPLTGMDLVTRIEEKTLEVRTRYLPCVDFLVLCQQDLRQGLSSAMQIPKNSRGYWFYNKFLQHLPSTFTQKNQYIMPAGHLNTAVNQLKSLLDDTEKGCYSGNVDSMKNSFLGGMRDGESWGLRKWLSKNGGALQICNDLELILGAFRQLEKGEETTIKLAERCCPKAKEAYKQLKQEVPGAYQEVSSAHPYLPFFHRLESALKGLMTFDPNKDDVIELDDSDEEEDEPTVHKGVEKSSSSASPDIFKALIDGATFSDNDSDIEIVCVKDKDGREKGIHSKATSLKVKSDPGADESTKGNAGNGSLPFGYDGNNNTANAAAIFGGSYGDEKRSAAEILADRVDQFASSLESGVDSRPQRIISLSTFWSPTDKYVAALRILQKMIVHPTSTMFIEPAGSTSFFQNNLNAYMALIKNPLCFREIVNAITLSEANKEGKLLSKNLPKKWSMYEGGYLIEATDLVFLNGLAFIGKSDTRKRKEIQKLRNSLWDEVRKEASFDRKNIPTKRAENSGFVIHK